MKSAIEQSENADLATRLSAAIDEFKVLGGHIEVHWSRITTTHLLVPRKKPKKRIDWERIAAIDMNGVVGVVTIEWLEKIINDKEFIPDGPNAIHDRNLVIRTLRTSAVDRWLHKYSDRVLLDGFEENELTMLDESQRPLPGPSIDEIRALRAGDTVMVRFKAGSTELAEQRARSETKRLKIEEADTGESDSQNPQHEEPTDFDESGEGCESDGISYVFVQLLEASTNNNGEWRGRGIHIGKLNNGVMVNGTTYRAKYDLESRHIRYIAPLYELEDLELTNEDLKEMKESTLDLLPLEERKSLEVGGKCDLRFMQIQSNGVWYTDRLMVTVKQTNVSNEVGHYWGQLEQPLLVLSDIEPGDWVEFSACHIANIHRDRHEVDEDDKDEEGE